MPQQIPNQLHFVWIGKSFPWFARLAVDSALLANPAAQAVLWAADDLDRDPQVRQLRASPRFSVQRMTEVTLFDRLPHDAPTAPLRRVMSKLSSPTARANLARLLLLASYGGVYVDTDTLTLRDLSPLRELGAFCGVEYVVWPAHRRYARLSSRVLGGPPRSLLRLLCSRLPGGEQLFSRLSAFYFEAANNAVLGFTAGHPFLLRTMEFVTQVDPRELRRRYRLGTHLLQQALRKFGAEFQVSVLPPQAFYPLGPELSRQYFRSRRQAGLAAARIVSDDTYLVHWYASVSELSAYDRERVLRERDQTVFSQLCARVLDRLATVQP